MPIYESDAWRKQYFDAVACPPDVHIPTDDIDAYRLNPRHRSVYYKLLVAQSQGLGCGLHDVAPRRYCQKSCQPQCDQLNRFPGTPLA